MKILIERPPLYDRICEMFPEAERRGVIFTWGDTIYNPSGSKVAIELHKHEEIHAERQGHDPMGWWEKYLEDMAFRIQEEIPAHHAEWIAFRKRHGHREKVFGLIVGRLCGPLYGKMITRTQAELAVLTGKFA